jgi:ferredoxin
MPFISLGEQEMDAPFEVLQIDEEADDSEVERAYRRRVKEVHPDQGGSVEAFLRVQAAYERIRGGDLRQPTAGTTPGRSDAAEDSAEETAAKPTVEYLNYEVLGDHGWSLNDDDLFENAAAEGLEPPDYGRIQVGVDDPLLQEAEAAGQVWPFSCRGGACANCAVSVVEGELSMPANHVLPEEMLDRGIRLSCVGTAATDTLKIVYNVKHLPDLDELRLPPRPFEQALND